MIGGFHTVLSFRLLPRIGYSKELVMRSMSLAVATATIILLSPVNASAQQAGTTDTTVTTGESDRDNDGFP